MAIESCCECGYPIKITHSGQITSCANCGIQLKASEGISEKIRGGIGIMPFLVGLGIGVFLGPSIISASKGGRAWLEKTARETETQLKGR